MANDGDDDYWPDRRTAEQPPVRATRAKAGERPHVHTDDDVELPDVEPVEQVTTSSTRTCPHCAETVKDGASTCPHCQKYIGGFLGAPLGCGLHGWSLWLVVALVGASCWCCSLGEPARPLRMPEPAATVDTEARPVVVVQVPMPATEEAFCRANVEAAAQFAKGSNDIQHAKALIARQTEVVKLLGKKGPFNDWVGRVEQLSTTNSHRATVEIGLPCGVMVGTWNNDISDILGGRTTVESSDPLFDKLAALTVGQTVVFSGNLVPEIGSHDFQEKSLTDSGSAGEPFWIMRLSAIDPGP